jgi:hypothetical protein
LGQGFAFDIASRYGSQEVKKRPLRVREVRMAAAGALAAPARARPTRREFLATPVIIPAQTASLSTPNTASRAGYAGHSSDITSERELIQSDTLPLLKASAGSPYSDRQALVSDLDFALNRL